MQAYDARRIASELMEQHGLTHWTFTFTTNKQRVGVCKYGDRTIGVSREFLSGMTEHNLRMVLLHEIAHALVGRGHAHDETWRSMCRRIGGDAKVSQSLSLPKEAYKWIARCAVSGSELGRVHRRGKRLATASCKCHRTPIRWVETR